MFNSLDTRRINTPNLNRAQFRLGLGMLELAQPSLALNGGWQVDQRNNGVAISFTNTTGYVADRCKVSSSALTTQTISGQQIDCTITGARSAKSVKFTVAGTPGAPAAAAFALYEYVMEGLDAANLKWGTTQAKPITVSFWVKAVNISGSFGLVCRNITPDRSFVTPFTLVDGRARLVTITIPGDRIGTWNKTTGAGLRIDIDLGSGTTYSGAATGAWQAGNYTGLTGGAKLVSTAASLEITDFKVEEGSIYTPFQPKPFAQDMSDANRYCYVWRAPAGGYYGWGRSFHNSASKRAYGLIPLPVPLRSLPTVTINGAYGFISDAGPNQGSSSTVAHLDVSSATQITTSVLCTGLVGDVWGFIGAYNDPNAATIIDAEL